jgi:hypothetical protein
MIYSVILVLCGLTAASPTNQKEQWEVKTKNSIVTVYARNKKDSPIQEYKSVGIIPAAPEAVFKVLTDFNHYKEIMPYTEESKIISTEQDGKVVYFYSLLNAPLVSRRDYVIRVVLDQSNWKDGKGFLKTSWTCAKTNLGLKQGVVRVKVNQGSWILESWERNKTRATYYLYTDPGGSLPSFVINRANSSAIPDIFRVLAKWSLK